MRVAKRGIRPQLQAGPRLTLNHLAALNQLRRIQTRIFFGLRRERDRRFVPSSSDVVFTATENVVLKRRVINRLPRKTVTPLPANRLFKTTRGTGRPRMAVDHGHAYLASLGAVCAGG